MIRQTHPTKLSIEDFLDQRDVIESTNRLETITDPFTYLKTIKPTFENNKKRLGSFNKTTKVAIEAEQMIFIENNDFSADTRIFPSHTIEREYSNDEHFVDQNRTLNINTFQHKDKKDIPLDIFDLMSEPEKKLVNYDDSFEEVPLIHGLFVGQKTKI